MDPKLSIYVSGGAGLWHWEIFNENGEDANILASGCDYSEHEAEQAAADKLAELEAIQ